MWSLCTLRAFRRRRPALPPHRLDAWRGEAKQGAGSARAAWQVARRPACRVRSPARANAEGDGAVRVRGGAGRVLTRARHAPVLDFDPAESHPAAELVLRDPGNAGDRLGRPRRVAV